MKKSLGFVLAGVLVLTGCGKTLEKDVVGKWSYEITQPVAEDNVTGQATLKCVSEFFPNKSLTHECDMAITMTGKNDGPKMNIEGTAKATGEWSVKDQTVFDKTVDGKIDVKKFLVNGEVVTDKDTLENMEKAFANPFMKGETTAYVTKSFDGKIWVFDQDLDSKTKVTTTATKQ